MSRSPIPVIDLSGLRSPLVCDRQAVATAIRQAAHEIGFFYIANHGIESDFLAQTLTAAKRFFDQSVALKNEVSITHSTVMRGYEPLGHQTLDLAAAPDWKEGYYIGVERGCADSLVKANLPNHGANQWPTQLPGWRSHMETYFAQMLALGHQLMGGLARSLALDESFFVPFTDNSMSILRLLHYPPQPPTTATRQFGCGAHTDWGCITILLQDDNGGLEICTPQGQWIEAPPIPDTFVINLGDMMARWTNDYYQSTPHRVVNRSGQDRYSIPFFFEANYQAWVECLSTCQSADNPPRYAPITAGEHIIEMYHQTYTTPLTAR